MTIDVDTARTLIGDGVPSRGPLPAAWWLTTDVKLIAAYDRWLADYEAHRDKIAAVCEPLGVPIGDVMMNGWGNQTWVVGFRSPPGMRLWPGHANHVPPPRGWRVDKKTDYLVPIRKTKADRESQANVDYQAIKAIPNVRRYVSGLPTEVSLDDRDFGGTSYAVNYRRGEACVWAYVGGDPDRQPDKRSNSEVDTARWTRMPLSTLALLMEEKTDRVSA